MDDPVEGTAVHDGTQLTLFGEAQTCRAPGCDRQVIPSGKWWRWLVCSAECERAERRIRETQRYAADAEWRAMRLARESARYRNETDRFKARTRAYRLANSERLRQEARAAYRADPSAKREAALKWARENPEKAAAIRRRRRAIKASADARLVIQRDLRRMAHRQRGCCLYCGRGELLTIEHVIPLSRGGRDSIGNYALVCKSCNSSKNNLLLMEYRLDRPRSRRRAG